jgi:AcrR family transcriptional regulator
MPNTLLTSEASGRADLKSYELLSAVKRVFAAKGFDGASMQDLARGAGISAGNFYRYFPSKNAIISALVERDLAHLEQNFAAVMSSPDPRAELRARVQERMETFADDDGPIWAEIEAASIRNTDVGKISEHMFSEIFGHLIMAFSRISGLPPAVAADRFGAHAAMMMMLVKGTAVQSCANAPDELGALTPQIRTLALRLIDHILDEVSAAGADAAAGGEV